MRAVRRATRYAGHVFVVTWVLGFVGHVGATRPPHIPARWVAGMWDSSEPRKWSDRLSERRARSDLAEISREKCSLFQVLSPHIASVHAEADKDGNMHATWYDDSCRDDE